MLSPRGCGPGNALERVAAGVSVAASVREWLRATGARMPHSRTLAATDFRPRCKARFFLPQKIAANQLSFIGLAATF